MNSRFLLTVAVAAVLATTVLGANTLGGRFHHFINDVEMIERVNKDDTLNWKATEHKQFAGWSVRDAQRLMGTILDLDSNAAQAPVKSHKSMNVAVPDTFDARTQWPNFIHAIRNQEQCGSCWAFAASEVLSDRFAIASNGSVNVVLSPEYQLECDSGDMGCSGGQLPNAWSFLEHTGIVTDTCDPYSSGTGTVGACPTTCADSETLKTYKAKSFSHFTTVEDIQKEIMTNGPVEAGFMVYKDFMSYTSGVYKKAWWHFTPLGGHAIKILGWGTESGEDYWLCANSWGPTWGESGFFKILRGKNECQIESQVYAGPADV